MINLSRIGFLLVVAAIAVVLVGLTIGIAVANAPDVVPTPTPPAPPWLWNLVLMLHLDESPAISGTILVDASGGGITGTLHTSDSDMDKSTAGRFGRALEFDGEDDYVTVPHHDSLNPRAELTLMAWVNLQNPGADQKIVGKRLLTTRRGYSLGAENNQLYGEIWDSVEQRHELRAGSILTRTWTHLAVTWKTGDYLIGYINGQEVGRTPASGNSIGTNDSQLVIGKAPWERDEFFVSGLIDEVAVFDRALSASEISKIYESGWGDVRKE